MNEDSLLYPRSGGAEQLTVIIPTACTPEREGSLLRALASIRSASVHPATVLLMANGPRVSAAVLDRVASFQGVEVHRLEGGSAPLATAAGRARVRTRYFGVLDDDDELLPGALDRRAAAFSSDANLDVVVSNGWRELAGVRSPLSEEPPGDMPNPLASLLRCNFFASCAPLFRTASVGPEFFERPHGYGEWTWLAFRLCLAGKRFHMLARPDYVIHDTPLSLSKSDAYAQSYVALFDRMLAESPPSWARAVIKAKRSAALHEQSERALQCGNRATAARLHWQSLQSRAGLRYLGFTRCLITGLPAKSQNDPVR